MNREPSNDAHGGMGTMPALYLTPASVSYLNQIILATLISGYLLIRFARRGAETRTSADWQLLAIFVSVILVSAAFFFEVTLLPAGRFVAVVLEIPLTILLLSVLIQFAYAFPHPIGSTLERRLALIFSGLYLAYEIGYAVWRLQLIGQDRVVYSSDLFDAAVIIGAGWIITTFVRSAFSSGGRAAQRMALVFCIPLALAVVNWLNSTDRVSDPVYYIALTSGMPFSLYLFTLAYLAAKPEATSLATRIIGAMITGLLAILGILGWLVAPPFADHYTPDIADQRSLSFSPVGSQAYHVESVPLDFDTDFGARIYPDDPTDAISDAGEARFPFTFYGRHYDGVFINTEGSLTFGSALNAGFLQIDLADRPTIYGLLQSYSLPTGAGIYLKRADDRLIVSYVNVASTYNPGVRYTFQIALHTDGAFTLTTHGLPEARQYAVNDRPDAAPWAFGITPGGHGGTPEIDFDYLPTAIGARGGIQDEYLAFRQAIHAFLLPFAIGSLMLALAFSIGFGLMIYHSLTVRIDHLIDGVRSFRRAGGPMRLPVVYNDEIGFLTATFNDMSIELGALIHDLEQRVAARTADLSAANLQLRKLSTAVEQSADAIVIMDLSGRIEYVNHAFCATLGYAQGEVIGESAMTLRSVATPSEVYSDLWSRLTRGETCSGELQILTKGGDDLWESVVMSPIRSSSGAVTHYAAVMENITDRKRAEQDRERLISLDPLTGLYNRRYFFEAAEVLFAQAANAPRRIAALMLDLDWFKDINDTYGHQGGDVVLCEAAHRIANSLRASELLARYGGEEFVVLLADVEPEDVDEIATRLIRAVNAAPVPFEGARIAVSVSLGAAIVTNETAGLDALLSRADRALYQAKRLGRNRWVWWDAAGVEEALEPA